jgi:glutaredoxin
MTVTLIKRSTPICPACNVMKTMLDGEGIEHEVIDITTDPGAVDRFGLTGVPVIFVDNGTRTLRFNGVAPIEQIQEAMGNE